MEHVKYARHIYANFRKAYTWLKLERLSWGATISCVEGDFNKNMGKIKKLSPGAYEYLMSKQHRN